VKWIASWTASAGAACSVTGSSPTRRIYAATAAEAHRSPATDAMIEVLRAASERFDRAAAA